MEKKRIVSPLRPGASQPPHFLPFLSLLLLPFANCDFHAYHFISACISCNCSWPKSKGCFQKTRLPGSVSTLWRSGSSQLAPATTFPSKVKANLNLVSELELLFIFANSFWHLLSKHINVPVKIFAALLNLSGRLNWGENGSTWITKHIIHSCHITLWWMIFLRLLSECLS